MKKIITILLFSLVFIPLFSIADKPPIKFGEVSMEDLKMRVYEPDTSAPAVILCNYGYFNSNSFQFTQILRIKIFKKEGYHWANHVFPGYNKGMLKGYTYNLENGEIVKSKLKSESIFKENINNEKHRLRVSMPNVKEGSVIDLKYTYEWIPSEWRFQETIPVAWSELKMEKNQYVSFRENFFGFEPLTVNEGNHWIAENMPAFKAEPYISSPENYLTKFEFDILEIHINMYHELVTTTWESLCDFLYDSPYFGEAMRQAGYLNKAAKAIEAQAGSDEEKLKAACDFIKTFKWNENESLLTSNSNIGFVIDDHSGNSADINIALIQLLEKLDFDVQAILLSTRENGLLSPIYPSLNKLNYVIASVNLSGEQIYVDGTEHYAPYYLLPERCLNYFGRVYDRKNSEMVNITTDKKDREIAFYNLNLKDDLKLEGQLNMQRYDYAALDFRKNYHQYANDESYLENMLQEFPGLRITDATIENADSIYLPVKDKYKIVLNNQIDQIGENLYLYPMLLHRMQENPFKADERKYPIDFIHNIDKTYVVNLTLPEGYEIASLPESITMKLPDNSAYFFYQISALGNSIQFNFKYGTNKPVFIENEYQNVKEFFNQIIAKHAEPVVLKKL